MVSRQQIQDIHLARIARVTGALRSPHRHADGLAGVGLCEKDALPTQGGGADLLEFARPVMLRLLIGQPQQAFCRDMVPVRTSSAVDEDSRQSRRIALVCFSYPHCLTLPSAQAPVRLLKVTKTPGAMLLTRVDFSLLSVR